MSDQPVQDLSEQTRAFIQGVLADIKRHEETQTDLIPFDQNGHLVSSHPSPHYLRGNIDRVRRLVEEGVLEASSALALYHRCHWCDQRPEVVLDGNVARLVTPCPMPNGITMTNALAVPSGKIVVADHLFPTYDPPLDDGKEGVPGHASFTAAMFAQGVAYGHVGNSCPTLYRTGPDTYAIASAGMADNSDSGSASTTGPTTVEIEGEALADIITDSWSYAIADHDDFTARGGQVGHGIAVVDVRPGVYRFVHHTGERSFDFEDYRHPQVFADIEFVG